MNSGTGQTPAGRGRASSHLRCRRPSRAVGSPTSDYFANGKLNHLNTYNGTTSATKVESHTVNYTLDPTNTASAYLDGNRTQDSFFALGASTTLCRTVSPLCSDNYKYDPRDRLVQESKDDHTNTSYYNPAGSSNLGLDPSGNITQEQIVAGGVTTTKNYAYIGNQLQKVTTNGVDSLYWYNDDSDLWCVTNSSGTKANCPISAQTTPPSTVQQAYAYDYLFRLQNYRAFTNGQLTDCANYKYDPLDRLVSEGETHGSGVTCSDTKTTQFTFAGLTNQMTEEQQSSGGSLQTTKDYSYDIYGHRMTEAVTPAGQAGTTYSFAYNVHDSVSLLLDPSGNAKTSYGYRPYGDLDAALTGGEPDKNNPFNPYRYAAKRFDSGSQTIDMGARRFATDTSKFLQPDQFNGALANLSLGTDPLSQNRYSLAGGNPLSSIEWDGHRPIPDGGGLGDPGPVPGDLSGIASSNHRDAGLGSATQSNSGGCDINCWLQRGRNFLGWYRQQAGEFLQGAKEGTIELGKSAIALGVIGVECQVDKLACGRTALGIGLSVAHDPGKFLGSLVDYDDFSHGRIARGIGHLAPAVALTLATGGVGGVATKGGEVGLAASRAPILLDTGVLKLGFEGNGDALALIRGGSTHVTPGVQDEFLNVAETDARGAFLSREGIRPISGPSSSDVYNSVQPVMGDADAEFAAIAAGTGYTAYTLDMRLVNFITKTLQRTDVPISPFMP
jgi:RHS repeat-associated protein